MRNNLKFKYCELLNNTLLLLWKVYSKTPQKMGCESKKILCMQERDQNIINKMLLNFFTHLYE
jgi:hypothetical protein